MAFWYPPPPPSQGPYTATPPIPHSTLGTQPINPPPQRQVQNALAMALILASWPSSTLEPTPHIANLTLKNAAVIPPPPVPVVPYVPQVLAQLQWTDSLEPRLIYPNNQQVKNAAVIPLPPIPPPVVPSSTLPPHILASWDPYEVELVTTWTIAPDNPDPPPVSGPLTPTEMAVLVRSWDPSVPRQPKPAVLPQGVPAPSVPVLTTPLINVIVRSWDPGPPPYQALRSLAWVIAPSPYNPVAPLPLPTATVIARQWIVDWPAQTQGKNAAWNIPTIAITAYTPPPHHLWTAWEPPAPYPPRPVSIVTATLPAGQQPPRVRPISNANLGALVSSWVQNWNAQRRPIVTDIPAPLATITFYVETNTMVPFNPTPWNK